MKNCKGFTLVELIVTLAISMVLLVSVSNVLLSSTNVANRTEAKADSELIAESLLDEIRGVTNLATLIEAGDGSEKEDNEKGNGGNGVEEIEECVLIDDRLLQVNAEGYPVFMTKKACEQNFTVENKIFADKFYKDKTIRLYAEEVDINQVDLTIQVYLGDKMMYEITSRLRPISAVIGGNKLDPTLKEKIVNSAKKWSSWLIKYFNKGDVIVNKRKTPYRYYVAVKDMWIISDIPNNSGYRYQRINFDRVHGPEDAGVDGTIIGLKAGDLYVDEYMGKERVFVYVRHKGDGNEVPSGKTVPAYWVQLTIKKI